MVDLTDFIAKNLSEKTKAVAEKATKERITIAEPHAHKNYPTKNDAVENVEEIIVHSVVFAGKAFFQDGNEMVRANDGVNGADETDITILEIVSEIFSKK